MKSVERSNHYGSDRHLPAIPRRFYLSLAALHGDGSLRSLVQLSDGSRLRSIIRLLPASIPVPYNLKGRYSRARGPTGRRSIFGEKHRACSVKDTWTLRRLA